MTNQNLQNIQNQNLQQPQQNQNQQQKRCNCRNGTANCPLEGKCMSEKSIIYTCKVTRLDDYSYETYTGMTKNTFKSRWDAHNSDARHRANSTHTTLSKHIWYLKDNNVPYQQTWSILDKAKSFNPVTGVCRLCLLEKYYIMYNPKDATLNLKSELYQPCNHKWQHTLKHAWGIKTSCYLYKDV